MRDLPIVGAECVERFRELFLDAISWYETTQISDEEKPEFENPKYSVLSDLKTKIHKKEELSARDHDSVILLEAIVSGYNKHLIELKEKPWSRKDTVKERLEDIDGIIRGNYLRIKLD